MSATTDGSDHVEHSDEFTEIEPTDRMRATAQYMLRRPEETDRLHDAVTSYPKDISEVKHSLLWDLKATQEQAKNAIQAGLAYHSDKTPHRSAEVYGGEADE
jgi:hypothetical protein